MNLSEHLKFYAVCIVLAFTTTAYAERVAIREVNYGKLPLSFEANEGQAAAPVKFLCRSERCILFLTPNEAVLALREPPSKQSLVKRPNGAKSELHRKIKIAQVRMKFVDANPAPLVKAFDELPGKSNYFIGKEPTKWHTNVPHYRKVWYQAVYPGIDAIFYGNQSQLEYDLVVAPGADPKLIHLSFKGPEKLIIDEKGNLVISTLAGEVIQHPPKVYQDVDGKKLDVAARYITRGWNQVGFEIAKYDTRETLFIDPVLSFSYSTYLGGSGKDVGHGIIVDHWGNAYVTGGTFFPDFPTENALQSDFGGGAGDGFVVKLNDRGDELIYATYLGGSGPFGDSCKSIAVDVRGNAYVTGTTTSLDFPTTEGVFQPTFGGVGIDASNAFVAKLNGNGSMLVYSTYLGAEDADGRGIAVNFQGNAYVTGSAGPDFPTTQDAFQPARQGFGGAYITKLNRKGSAIVFSTYLGGGIGVDIALDHKGNTYITGLITSTDFPTTEGAFQQESNGNDEAFVAKMNRKGDKLIYASYLGGSRPDIGLGIAVDRKGEVYVTGRTLSPDFPTRNALQPDFAGSAGFGDAFVTKLNAKGSALVYSTYLGGTGHDEGSGIAVSRWGNNAYVTGRTSSLDFPIENALQSDLGGGADAFVAKLNRKGSSLVYSTYLGGTGDDIGFGIAVSRCGNNAYVTGETTSLDFPTENSAQADFGEGLSDAFVAKIATNFIQIDRCDTGVVDQVLEDGSTISDLITKCAEGAHNPGQFVSRVAHLTNGLRRNGFITGAEKGAIQSCAAQTDIP